MAMRNGGAWSGVALLLEYLDRKGACPKKKIVKDFSEIDQELRDVGFPQKISFRAVGDGEMRSRELEDLLGLCHSAEFIKENGQSHTYELSEVGKEQIQNDESPLRKRIGEDIQSDIESLLS